jgi:hypothetical protein
MTPPTSEALALILVIFIIEGSGCQKESRIEVVNVRMDGSW